MRLEDVVVFDRFVSRAEAVRQPAGLQRFAVVSRTHLRQMKDAFSPKKRTVYVERSRMKSTSTSDHQNQGKERATRDIFHVEKKGELFSSGCKVLFSMLSCRNVALLRLPIHILA